ncbi:MAG: leucine--tRNA ligase [Candidatus Aenigmarchaeota archaeon]|nr:leucine--tRNA ligase [Candidatus Aenigmarchaeota archaeon]
MIQSIEKIHDIERKWQKKWEEARIFEADPSDKPKFFITFPYPYVNGAPHIGHSYSAFRVDCYARFKRMQRFNVLFPQGFHATGEPILGVVERLRKGDEVQIRTMKLFGATDEEIEKMKKDPKYVALFWKRRWIEDLKMAGFSIDWRRTFITTTITPQYSRFIEWQYNTLQRKGYVRQGTHPVIWCPHCQSPTGDHDRLEGEGESPIEYVLIKFKLEDSNVYLPCGTLRPETVYGVTNVWVNPDVTYVKAKVDGETWIISKDAVIKLNDQLKKVKIIEEVEGKDLLGKRVVEPISNRKVPILPAKFVDPANATGIVMSVPSHAPYDWIAIKELLDKPEELERYGVTKDELEPISIIKAPGLGEHPAIEIVERMGIKSSEEKEKLDEATKIVYKKEFHQGVLKDNCGQFSGMKVSEVKDALTEEFKKTGIADSMWETTGRVVCRCTTVCHVKILEDQWFLNFSNPRWKELAKKCLANMKIYPEEARQAFLATIDWLKDKACTRKTGLGTPLPWDKEWIVETLSDSTIYMAYYTIAKIINEKNIPAEKLTDEVFDHIFLSKGNLEEVAKSSGLDKETIQQMKEEFEYFYPVDLRNSGKDLLQNHLTFFIFHHVAVWDEMPDKWPRAIGVNGFVKVEGEKMSKSKGNIIPLRDLVKQYGADFVRINIVSASEDLEDADWRAENIKSFRNKTFFLFDLINSLEKMKGDSFGNAEKNLLSRLQKIIKATTEFYEKLKFRSGVQQAFFESINEIKWYLKRVGGVEKANRDVVRKVLTTITKLLAPMMPHLMEEFWQKLGNDGFVALAKWPEYEESYVDEEAELGEQLVRSVAEDVNEIIKLVGKKPNKIRVFVADSWKFDVYKRVLETGRVDIKEFMKDEKYRGKEVVSYLQKLSKKVGSLNKQFLEKEKQYSVLKEAIPFLSTEFRCEVEVEHAEESDNPKARNADVTKPGIYVE